MKPYIEILKNEYGDQVINDRIEMSKNYFDYVVKHAENVRMVWEKLWKLVDGIGIDYWIEDFEFFTINGNIEYHDVSKFSAQEFWGYAQYFYPENGREKNKNAFDFSWNHHQKHNPHHWEYWLMYENGKIAAKRIPFSYLIEMLCDWGAMSYKFKNLPSEWYSKQTHILIHEKSKLLIERWLPKLDEAISLLVNSDQQNGDE